MPEPSVTTSRADFRPDIEGLRGLAVLVVVLFHAGLAGMPGGFVGVDVFFVISGFLITGLLMREHERTGRIAMLHFYARRARRLLPAAVVVLTATLIAALSLVAPLDRPAIGLDGAAAALSIGNIRFALAAGDYFSSVTAPSPFLHFWSLAVEEQFYLVWPALLLIAARGMHPRRRVLIVLAAVVVASLAANLIVTEVAANWAFYSLPTRAWELAIGGLIAVGAGAPTRTPGPILGLAGWLGLIAIGVATVTFDSSLAYPGAAALVPTLGAAALIAGGTSRFGPGRLLSIAPMRFLGKISYSLYLVHWPILVLVPVAVGTAPDALSTAGLVGASVIAAIACWLLIETPFRTGLPTLAKRPGRTVSIGLTAVLAVVVFAAGPSFGASIDAAAPPDVASPPVTDAPDEPWPDEFLTPTPLPGPTDRPTAQPPTANPTVTPDPAPTPTQAPARDVVNSGRLPSGVKPVLANARGDEERLRADGCLAFEGVTKPAACSYGAKNAAFTVALVGDSHAAHWFPALERLARHKGWRVLTFVKVACPFIDMPVGNIALKREYRECAAFNQATIDRLESLKPDLTLVSMSRLAIHAIRDADDTVAAKGAAIGRMLDRVPGRTAVIVDTPYAKIDVPSCLSSHKDDIDACAIRRAIAFTDQHGAIESAAAKASRAGLIDLTERICVGEGPCSVVVNGMIVFRDHSHLTATFSRSLAPALGAAIGSLLAE